MEARNERRQSHISDAVANRKSNPSRTFKNGFPIVALVVKFSGLLHDDNSVCKSIFRLVIGNETIFGIRLLLMLDIVPFIV